MDSKVKWMGGSRAAWPQARTVCLSQKQLCCLEHMRTSNFVHCAIYFPIITVSGVVNLLFLKIAEKYYNPLFTWIVTGIQISCKSFSNLVNGRTRVWTEGSVPFACFTQEHALWMSRLVTKLILINNEANCGTLKASGYVIRLEMGSGEVRISIEWTKRLKKNRRTKNK